MPMIAMTTSSSTSVKARRECGVIRDMAALFFERQIVTARCDVGIDFQGQRRRDGLIITRVDDRFGKAGAGLAWIVGRLGGVDDDLIPAGRCALTIIRKQLVVAVLFDGPGRIVKRLVALARVRMKGDRARDERRAVL